MTVFELFQPQVKDESRGAGLFPRCRISRDYLNFFTPALISVSRKLSSGTIGHEYL